MNLIYLNRKLFEADAETVTAGAPAVTPPAADVPKPEAKPDAVQKRIDQMTYKFREQERRANAAEEKVREYEERERAAKTTAASEPEKRKTLADFDYDDVAYEDYLAERVTQRASKTAAEQATKAVEEREQTKAREATATERATAWKARAESFAKDHPDFVERVYGQDLAFTDAVAELLADSELGPQIAYHLAQNTDELSRISRLSPAAAGREIGKLEAKFTVAAPPAEEQTKQPAEEIARAPEPPKVPPPPPKLQTVGNSSTRPSTTSAQSDKLSDDEWMKAENKRLAAKRAGK